MPLIRYHMPQVGAGIYIQRGGSLTRYHTPQLSRQRGAGLSESLLKIAGPSVVKALQKTVQDVQGGQSLTASARAQGTQLTKSLKRKLPRMALVAGGHAVKSKYKKARRRVKDIFNL